jgi:hypothetical protein
MIMKFLACLFLMLICSSSMFAQDETVNGFVIDKESKQRLAKVYIYNSRNDEGTYNTTKGEFTVKANPGDTLFAALQGYALDTIVVKGQKSVYFQLQSLGINLKEVSIVGKERAPKDRYNQSLKEYKYALDKGSSKDLLNLGQGGVGLGIDAIYNLLSREGKNARHLQKILERDYREAIIDYRYRPDYVKRVLQLNEEQLKDFMQQYRPTYQFVLSASDYAFVVFLKNNYSSYQRNPAAFRLPDLPKLDSRAP